MNEHRSNRLLSEIGAPRVVACLGLRHPNVEHLAAYRDSEFLARRCGLDLRYAQARAVDPRGLPVEALPLLDRELYVSASDLELASAREHFEHTSPERVRDLVHEARSALGSFADPVLAARPWAAAFATARSARAWRARMVVTARLGDGAVIGFVVSRLLGIPWIAAASRDLAVEPRGPWMATGSLILSAADLIVPTPAEAHAKIEAQLGEHAGTRLVSAVVPGELEARVAALLDVRPAAAITMGPRAALVTDETPEADPGGPVPFVIIGAERTGSNMLVGMIRSRDDVVIGGELFNRRMCEAGELPWDTRNTAHADRLRALRAEDPRGFLREIAREAAELRVKAWGFKLLYYHGSIQNQVVDHLVALPRLRVIHLRRRDRLRRWLSHRRAEVTDSWYASKRQRVDGPITVELGVEATLEDFLQNEWMEERYEALFEGHPVLELDYESFTTDITGTAEKLAAFLDMPVSDLEVQSRKTGTSPLRRSIADFEDVASALALTRWRDQADDDSGEGAGG